jgi:hypothetical protein
MRVRDENKINARHERELFEAKGFAEQAFQA